MWPLAVAMEGRRYCYTLLDVSSDQVLKLPVLMAFVHVDVTGLNMVR